VRPDLHVVQRRPLALQVIATQLAAARRLGAVQQQDVAAALREFRGDGAATRSGPDDDHVVVVSEPLDPHARRVDGIHGVHTFGHRGIADHPPPRRLTRTRVIPLVGDRDQRIHRGRTMLVRDERVEYGRTLRRSQQREPSSVGAQRRTVGGLDRYGERRLAPGHEVAAMLP
jgi:hypothetical protein